MRELRGTATAVALTLLVAAALVVNARLTAGNVRRVAAADARIGHTHEVLETLQAMLSSLQDAETGQRGFIITGDHKYLAPYDAGRTLALGRLNRLAELTCDDLLQQQRVVAMRRLVEQKLGELEHTIAIRKSATGGFEVARAVVLSDDGKRVMDALRADIAEMVSAERLLLAERARASAIATRTATITNVLGLVGSLALLMAAFGAWRSRTRERERAAAFLNEEKEKFQATLTSIGDGVVVTDHVGRITILNATASSVLGWNDDAVGRPLDEVFRIVNEDTREPVESPVRKVLRDGKVAGLANHTVLVRRDGSEVPIDDSGAPIRDGHGKMVGVVLVFRDIGERREAERELQRRADILDDHRSLFASKGVALECNGREPLWVEADVTRLAQVTENLLHNAAKFTSRGDRVTVSLKNENGYALVRIRDTGVGIDRDALAKLFQPFTQGERTLHRTPGGLGLGLALTKSIVELHGGTVQALSEGPGKGAEFVVAWPLARNVALPALRIVTPTPSGRLRICVIDDNEDAAETLHDVLEIEGHDVHVAMDGQLGIELALAVHPDVVLCDLDLPGIDGFEVARFLRAAGSTALLIALSGYASAEDVQHARDVGFDHHLAKPTDLDRLNAVLARAVVSDAGSAASPASPAC